MRTSTWRSGATTVFVPEKTFRFLAFEELGVNLIRGQL